VVPSSRLLQAQAPDVMRLADGEGRANAPKCDAQRIAEGVESVLGRARFLRGDVLAFSALDVAPRARGCTRRLSAFHGGD